MADSPAKRVREAKKAKKRMEKAARKRRRIAGAPSEPAVTSFEELTGLPPVTPPRDPGRRI